MKRILCGFTLALLAAGCQDHDRMSESTDKPVPPTLTHTTPDKPLVDKPVVDKPVADPKSEMKPAADVKPLDKYFEWVEGGHVYVFSNLDNFNKFRTGDHSLAMTTRAGLGMKGNQTVSFENGPDDLQDRLMAGWVKSNPTPK